MKRTASNRNSWPNEVRGRCDETSREAHHLLAQPLIQFIPPPSMPTVVGVADGIEHKRHRLLLMFPFLSAGGGTPWNPP